MFPATQLFLLGAAKAGTTALAYWLDSHSSIVLSRPKEPVFFEYEYHKGIDYYWSTYFDNRWNGELYVVDARHRNLFLPFVPHRIYDSIPNPRFLISLREPISRAYSHWWHWRSRGMEALEFRAAVQENRDRLEKGMELSSDLWGSTLDPVTGTNAYRTYLDSGFYVEQIVRYLDLFGPDRVKIVFFEEWTTDHRVLEDILAFLGLHVTSTLLERPPQINKGTVRYEMRTWKDMSEKVNPNRNLRRYVPKTAKRWIKNALSQRVTRPAIDDATTIELADLYNPYNRDLEVLLRRKLPSSWGTY